MGFISRAFDKSVFNKSSYKAAIGSDTTNGYAVVRISPVRSRIGVGEDPKIVGVLDSDAGGFSFDIQSEWKDFGGIASSLVPGVAGAVEKVGGIVNAFGNASDLASLGAAYASKLHYQKSNYMTIKIPMMVVDWNGEGQPLLCAQLLAYYSLPVTLGNVIDILGADADNALEDLKNYLWSNNNYKILQLVEDAQYYAKKAAEGVKTTGGVIDKSVDNATNSTSITSNVFGRAVKSALEDADDLVTLRSSPVPLRVQIGQYFDNDDMVLKSVDFSFSKEMTKSGPLFAKFNLNLSTRKILTNLDDVGLVNMYDRNDRFLTASFT